MAFIASSNLCDVVAEHASESPGQPAVIFANSAAQGDAEAFTYAKLTRHAWGLAGWLQSRLEPGSRVMLTMPTGPQWVTAFLGCLAAGMVAVPAPAPNSYQNARRRTAGIIRNSGTTLVLTTEHDLPAVTAWAHENNLAGVDFCAVPETGGTSTPPRAVNRRSHPDDLAFLQYTSGSTGEPKGVMVTNANIAANTALFRNRLGMDTRTRFGGWIPLYHDMGLITLLCVPLSAGATTAFMPAPMFLRHPADWLHFIQRYELNMSAAPNFAYDLCTRAVTRDQAAALDLSRWRYAINGSEPVHEPTLAAFAAKFAVSGFAPNAILPAYGMAEATVFVCAKDPSAPVRKLAVDPGRGGVLTPDPAAGPAVVSCGSPEGFDVRIVDPDTHVVLPDRCVGEIWLRGTSVAQGYWRRADSTAATFRATTAAGEAGWLRTGDLGAVSHGELFITGRLKEMLVIHGRNLFPQDLEQETRAVHPALTGLVGAAFSVTAPDERAVIVHEVNVRAAGGELPEIAAAIKARLTEVFAIPARNVILVRRGAVQRTTSGKIERIATRQLFTDGGLRAVYSDIEPAVARLIREQEPAEAEAETVAAGGAVAVGGVR